MKRLPRYTEVGRYAYHFFLHWRDGKWQQPIRGSIKSKPVIELFQ